jgi:AraC-like DNA-binding protein
MVAGSLRIENHGGTLMLRGGRLARATPLTELALECRFRVDLICRRLGISDRHLHRVFSESLALAPKDWLRRQRMVTARWLLRQGVPVKEVALDLGFAHPKDFTREFRECYGMPPTAFVAAEALRAF